MPKLGRRSGGPGAPRLDKESELWANNIKHIMSSDSICNEEIMGQMKLEELEQVTYLNIGAIGSRTVNLMPYWDGTSWHQWIPGPTGLMSLRVIEVEQSDYIAKTAASDSDLWVPFVDLM